MLASVLTGNDLVLVQGAGNIGKIARHLAEIKLIRKNGGGAPWLIKSRCFSVEPPLNVKCR
jgi:UDP-N-acetylmuramate--alanine ligase